MVKSERVVWTVGAGCGACLSTTNARRKAVSFFLLMAGLILPNVERPEIQVPRSWLLGEERSRSQLRQSDVVKLLGQPELFSSSLWRVRWNYPLGIWFDWECPVFSYCLADRLGPEAMALLLVATPVRARPLLWLAEARVRARESLLEFGWSAWGLKAAWGYE
jgi:hypothetical protein